MDEFPVRVNLKRATTRRNEGERFDSFAELEDFGRQTDGLRRVVSNHAVFNRNFGFHLVLLSNKKGTDSWQRGQGASDAYISSQTA